MIKTAPHSTKRLVYTPPDLLARFCKANLSNGKNSAGFAFQVFGLMYCDQEPLWTLNEIVDDCYFLGVLKAVNSM